MLAGNIKKSEKERIEKRFNDVGLGITNSKRR
jgi:hypothetical protein